jgi:NAD(P)-dependent dehydrogenase (short-subunit alcohol dehydrogenase family)
MDKLSGNVAFVTGGASGIGRAIVGALTPVLWTAYRRNLMTRGQHSPAG